MNARISGCHASKSLCLSVIYLQWGAKRAYVSILMPCSSCLPNVSAISFVKTIYCQIPFIMSNASFGLKAAVDATMERALARSGRVFPVIQFDTPHSSWHFFCTPRTLLFAGLPWGLVQVAPGPPPGVRFSRATLRIPVREVFHGCTQSDPNLLCR